MSIGKILTEITAERHAQDALWGGPGHDDGHSPSDWIALLARHLGLAVDDGTPNRSDPERRRKQLVRLAALAVAAIEAHDRRSLAVWQAEADRLGEALLLLDRQERIDGVRPCTRYGVAEGAATPFERQSASERLAPKQGGGGG
jgi:hypothetical protein